MISESSRTGCWGRISAYSERSWSRISTMRHWVPSKRECLNKIALGISNGMVPGLATGAGALIAGSIAASMGTPVAVGAVVGTLLLYKLSAKKIFIDPSPGKDPQASLPLISSFMAGATVMSLCGGFKLAFYGDTPPLLVPAIVVGPVASYGATIVLMSAICPMWNLNDPEDFVMIFAPSISMLPAQLAAIFGGVPATFAVSVGTRCLIEGIFADGRDDAFQYYWDKMKASAASFFGVRSTALVSIKRN